MVYMHNLAADIYIIYIFYCYYLYYVLFTVLFYINLSVGFFIRKNSAWIIMIHLTLFL